MISGYFDGNALSLALAAAASRRTPKTALTAAR
jgi:hypothetical protein